MKPNLKLKPELANALLDNLIDQARRQGQNHLWVYLPKTEETLIHHTQAKHTATAVSLEEAQKALHFAPPEVIQSAFSTYNLINLKLFHIKL